jgi:hypothetical protein
VLRRTLGIAGKLIKDMGFDTGNDWDDAMELMLEETEAGGEARSAEDQVISTSLRAIRGPEGHQQSIRNLLRSFALVPEDVKCVERASIRRTIIVVCMAHNCVCCRCPSEVLVWVYEACAGDGDAPTTAKLRRWTKLLMDRSLVLGPVDKPSLHDIVLD